jgi:hypothetical protein
MAVVMTCAYGGTGHYLWFDNIPGCDVRGSHTIMARIKWSVTTATERYHVASLLLSAGTSGSFVGRVNSDAGGTTVTRGGRHTTTPAYNYVGNTGSFGNTTTWYHLAMVYNASTQLCQYYVNGVSAGTISSLTTFVGTDTAGAFGIFAKGRIADAAVYNRALTATEVARMSAYRVPLVTSNLQGFWRMDTNATGGTASGPAADTSGNSRNLTVQTGAGGTGLTYSTTDNPPQAESPTAVTPTGSTTTSGAATVTKTQVFQLGACTGSASTAGSAAVSMSNVVPTGATATSATNVEVFRPGKQGWRAPLTIVNPVGPSTSFTGSSAFTIAAYFKAYRYNSGGSLSAVVQLSNGTDPNTAAYLNFTSASNALARMQMFNGASVIPGTDTGNVTVLAGEWWHLAITYDGTDYRAYINGVLETTATVSLPTGPTSRVMAPSFRTSGANTYVDMAQLRIWKGVALSAGNITAEMTSIYPATNLSFLERSHLLLWDNPGWDSGPNNLTFNNFNSSGSDSSNGPPSNFTASSASGTTSTTGAAQVSRIYALGACTGGTSTAGTAAVSVTYNYTIVPTGATQTTGSADLNRVYAIVPTGATNTAGTATVAAGASAAASGLTQATGGAAVSLGYNSGGSGATQASGASTLDKGASAAASGSATTSGSAANTITVLEPGAGATQTTGAAAVGTGYDFASSGSAATSGTAALAVVIAITASGSTQTTGATSTAGTLDSTGVTQTSGTALFDTALFPLVASGASSTSGSAAVDSGLPMSADGSTSTAGTATVTASAQLVASGATSTSGMTLFVISAAANTQTIGTASVVSSAALAATGSTSAAGSVDVGKGIFGDGLCSTSGAAAMTRLVQITAAGMTTTNGSAAFDGVAPIGGGSGGEQNYMRRQVAIGVGRRRVR